MYFPVGSPPLGLIGATAGLGIITWIGIKTCRRIQYVGPDEQILVKRLTEKVIVNGPTVYFPSPLTTLSFKKRKGINLTALQYLVVEDESTGQLRVVEGPGLVLLGPYEVSKSGPLEKSILGPNDPALIVTDRASGQSRLVKGPATFVPGSLEEITGRVTPITLTKSQYVKLQDKLSGKVWVEVGEKLLFLEPNHIVLGKVSSAYALKAHEYIRLQDSVTGITRVEHGEQLVFPCAFEEVVDGCVLSATDLKAWEYVVVQDMSSGKVRVERGEKLVWLGRTERILGGGKQQAVTVDQDTAALVRNQRSGVLTLVQQPQLFFPSEDEEVVEVRKRIKLADNEAIILKDGEGKYHFRYGNPDHGEASERSFFLPPYYEEVVLNWSRGRRRERRDLAIKIFDMRPQFMSFEFNCRTSDNVEMILEGTFFWEIVDLPAMLRFTGDASGDVCAHARSCFIQLVSKVTLQTFMDSFNEIAKSAFTNDDQFYSQRGIKIHTLEVTRYQCSDSSTAIILEAIIQETTNRMNRLSCQESENEVALAKLRGQVEQERATTEVLAIQNEHRQASACAEGKAEAERCLTFLAAVGSSEAAAKQRELGGPELSVTMWRELRRNEALATVATGSAHVYFTPQDAHLSIESKA